MLRSEQSGKNKGKKKLRLPQDQAKVKAQAIFTFVCYKLTRIATLLGWRLSARNGGLRPLIAARRTTTRVEHPVKAEVTQSLPWMIR
ncbi:MAG: hypothetical protein FWG81_03020 [Betaproteobacteria bacterium]|nr:hypothetical protein [Betaproteobacteria bacterium]